MATDGWLKGLIAITCLAVLAATESTQAQGSDEVCRSVGEAAEFIMQERQNGADKSELMQVAQQMGEDGQGFISFIEDAYAQPRYSNPDDQRQAAEDFRALAEAYCDVFY